MAVQVTNTGQQATLFRGNAVSLTRVAAAPSTRKQSLHSNRMTDCSGQDPLEEVMDDLNNGDVRIREGIVILMESAFSRNEKYGDIDGKKEQREENGGYTDAELHMYGGNGTIGFVQEYTEHLKAMNEATWDHIETNLAPNTEMGSIVTGHDGQQYAQVFEVNEQGEKVLSYLDNGLSCSKTDVIEPKALTGMDALAVMTPSFDQNYKMVADKKTGEMQVVELSPTEKLLKQTITEMEKPYSPENLYSIGLVDNAIKDAANAPQFTTAAGTTVTTNVAPTEPFNAAATADKPPAVTSLVGFRKPTVMEELGVGTKTAAPAINDPVFNPQLVSNGAPAMKP